MAIDLAAELPERIDWPAAPQPADIEKLPNNPAVYLLTTADHTPVQLASTQQLRRAVLARLARIESDGRSKRAELGEIVRGVSWRSVSCAFEARWRYFLVARALHPDRYRKLISFGPAWFLHVDDSRPAAEIRVTERIWSGGGEYLGVWPTQRSAQFALESLFDLFDLCRYPEQVRKAPVGQRCAYVDMGRCDAPCDGSAPIAVYNDRLRSAWDFASGSAALWIEDATARMRTSAAAQRFEAVALIKQQIETARKWNAGATRMLRTRRDYRMLIAIPATRRKAVKLFAFLEGQLIDGPLAPLRKTEDVARSWLSQIGPATADRIDADLRMEQSWLVAHLLGHREGQSAALITLADPIDPASAAALVARRFAQ